MNTRFHSFQIPVAVASDTALGLPQPKASPRSMRISEQGPHGPYPHGPEIILLPKTHDAVFPNANIFMPQIMGLIAVVRIPIPTIYRQEACSR